MSKFTILAKEDRDYCREIGTKRAAWNKNDKNWKWDAMGTWYEDLDPAFALAITFGAEIVVARFFKVEPEAEIGNRLCYDVKLPTGVTIDIKMIVQKHHNLLVKHIEEKERPDFYALVLNNMRLDAFGKYQTGGAGYRIVGYAASELVHDDKWKKEAGDLNGLIKHPCYLYPQKKLTGLPQTTWPMLFPDTKATS